MQPIILEAGSANDQVNLLPTLLDRSCAVVLSRRHSPLTRESPEDGGGAEQGGLGGDTHTTSLSFLLIRL